MVTPLWLTAFLDFPAESHDAVAFWRGVTGYELSPSRGEHDEFATLLPPEGDPFLRVQRVDDGPGGVHLDVHRPGQAFEVHRSPGGLAYCLVSEALAVRPPPATWPDGHRSLVDQVCLDIPPRMFDEECEFWRELTGCELRDSPVHPDFRGLVRREGEPIRLLLQRVGDDRPRVTAHLDLATDDRSAETARHEALGAVVMSVNEWWTVLTDPAGLPYCITDRNPETGLLG